MGPPRLPGHRRGGIADERAIGSTVYHTQSTATTLPVVSDRRRSARGTVTVLESQDRGLSRWVEIDVGLDQLTEMVRSRAPNPLRIIERVHARNDPRGKVPGSGPVFLVWLITYGSQP